MKSLLKEDAAEIIPHLLPGATLLEALDIEVVRTPMRADRVYRIHYRRSATHSRSRVPSEC